MRRDERLVLPFFNEYHELFLNVIYTSSLFTQFVSESFLKRERMTMPRVGVLFLLYHYPGLKQSDVANRLIVSAPNVSGLIRRLEKDGMLTRTAKLPDRREKHCRLTRKGRSLVERLKKDAPRSFEEMGKYLGVGEAKKVVKALEKLRVGLLEFERKTKSREQTSRGRRAL